MRRRQVIWRVVLRLTAIVTAVSALVVVVGASAIWMVEGERPDRTIRSYGDALWWSLTTLTTVGYGDHVPVTTTGRFIAAAVMVAGIAVIGGVAAIVALAVSMRVAQEEERVLDAEAELVTRRLEVRLERMEATLDAISRGLQAPERAAPTAGNTGPRQE